MGWRAVAAGAAGPYAFPGLTGAGGFQRPFGHKGGEGQQAQPLPRAEFGLDSSPPSSFSGMDPADRLEGGRPELTERRDLQRPLQDGGGGDGGAEAAVAAFAGHPQAQEWLAQQVALLQPQSVEVCDGSDAEFDRLCALLVQRGVLTPLNPKLRPRSFLARSSPSDVARVENRTFVCSQTRAEAGLTNNWEEPQAMKEKLSQLFRGSMRGRTMYVIPYSMGHPNSPFAKIGIQVTDSPYVVCNMKIMARIGKEPLKVLLANKKPFVPGTHSVGAPLEPGQKDVAWPCNETKYIVHFPETQSIFSYGSGYGGNALLGKKCFALRIAGVQAREEGWLAEHMLILGITNPEGRKKYFVAAFPSACGKTNLAMLQPSLPGWKVECVGDDIAWLRVGKGGRLFAVNPEAGFFGVAPGTSAKTNPNAVATIGRNCLFTNCALTDEGDVWWEGLTKNPPAHLIDWKGQDWRAGQAAGPAAHPNARFTAPLAQCPAADLPGWQDPQGVEVSAVLFGGRRGQVVPLVAEAPDWLGGVLAGASVASEATAAAQDQPSGHLRHDPFAMLPFLGYPLARYCAHWLRFDPALAALPAALGEEGARLRPLPVPAAAEGLPRMFQVNWFRQGPQGEFLWPGFGENIRVLRWIFDRTDEPAGQESPLARRTPIGFLPREGAIDTRGLQLPEGAMRSLTSVDVHGALRDLDSTSRFFRHFAPSLPPALLRRLEDIRTALHKEGHNKPFL